MPSRTKLMDLPVDILIEVFSRLPATSLLRLQCVSRTLRDLVNNPALVAMHLRYKTTIQDLEPPQLRVLGVDRMWSPMYKLVFVYCGLLGFADYSGGPLLLYNPMRSELLKLPVCEVDQHSKLSEFYFMGLDAVSNNHKLVHVYDHKESISPVAHVHVLGTKSWCRIPSVPPCRCKRYMNDVSAYGKMHGLVNHDYRCEMKEISWILSFDIEKEEFGWTPHPNFPNLQLLGLINMRGSMTLVNFSKSTYIYLEIWTLKNYSQRWEKDYCIDIYDSSLYKLTRTTIAGAWEHGIALVSSCSTSNLEFHFYDLKSVDTVGTQLKFHMPGIFHTFNYTPSLISLKKCGELLESTEWPNYISELKI